jgi:signal transduction histidine kinase
VIVSSGFASYALAPATFSASLVSFAAISLVLLLTALVSGLVGDRMKRIIARRQAAEREKEQRQLHAAREHTRLTFELASTLSATLNYDKVLQAMLEVGEKGLRELSNGRIKQVGVVMLFSRDHLRIVASRHLPLRDRNLVFDSKKGVLAEALNTAESVLTDDPVSDPELGRLIAMHQCKQAVVVPLRAGFESFGVVVFGSSKPNTYDEDLQDMLMAISNQAIVALQNAQLYQDLREEKERIVAVEEDARKKLARDLHDGPTQTIASIAMKVNYARMLLREQSDVEKATDELEQVEDLARHTTKEIRHMLFTLRPLILETQGLRAALEQYISKLQETSDLPVHLEAKPEVDQMLDRDDQGVLFYIIEEAIGNARKHAQPDNVWVRLYLEGENTLIAEVEDDGEGFDVETVQASYDQRGSLGLVNMHERAEMLDGEVSISSAPGEGTKITLSVPLDRR